MSSNNGPPKRHRRVLRSVPGTASDDQSAVHVGQRLRQIRQRCGYTQEQAAAAAGLTRNTLVSLERARFPDPRLSTLLALMRAYQLGSLEDLIGPLPSARLASAWQSDRPIRQRRPATPS
jgi:DNA-binding XRE family transcriptional regulator